MSRSAWRWPSSSAKLVSAVVARRAILLTIQIHNRDIGSTDYQRLGHYQTQAPRPSGNHTASSLEREGSQCSLEVYGATPLNGSAPRHLVFIRILDADLVVGS